MYCICWSDKITKEINSTLFQPFFYCHWCGKLYETVLVEIWDESFDWYSDMSRKERVIELWKLMYFRSKVTIDDLKKIWIIESD